MPVRIANFGGIVGTLGKSVVRRGARKKNRQPPKKICFKKKAGHFLKKCPTEIDSNFLVAIVVVTIFFVPAFVLAVVVVPATVVPIAVMVPVMVVLEMPVRTAPVASIVAALSIMWNDPDCANIRWARPVASVPVIMTDRKSTRLNSSHLGISY